MWILYSERFSFHHFKFLDTYEKVKYCKNFREWKVHDGWIIFDILWSRSKNWTSRIKFYGSHFWTISCNWSKSYHNVIFGKDLPRKFGINPDFQNNFVDWKVIKTSIKSINYNMKIHFAIQDSKNIKSATDRIKQILDAKYEKGKFKRKKQNQNI